MVRAPAALAALVILTSSIAAEAATLQCGGPPELYTCTLLPEVTGMVRHSPSSGALDVSDETMFSSCDVPAPGDVEYRRAYVEFDLQNLGIEVAAATLTLRETLEVGEYPAPVALHELSYYAGDLVVDGGDLDVPATPLAVFHTDDGEPGQFFEFDVTDAVRGMEGGNIGFRVKLAGDPAGTCDPQGAMFDGLLRPDPPVLTLTPVFPLAVPVDAVPGECPSPLDLHDNKLVVAINGHEDLDVRSIDPATVTVWQVRPLKIQIKDVSTPYFPARGKQSPFDCLSDGRDGFADLVMVFDTRALVAMYESWIYSPGGLLDGQLLRLSVAGSLKQEAGGERIAGERIAGEEITIFHRSK